MAWFTKKADPISQRARALNNEIAALEAQIQKLDSQLQNGGPQLRFRSTAVPHGPTLSHTTTLTQPPPAPVVHEPIFEEHPHEELKTRTEAVTTPDHYNEFGVRKYDLVATLDRVRQFFHGPTASNPKLVQYLGAGSIQGLRPLRYEKRVARNRFILLATVLFFGLLGIVTMLLRHY